MNPDSSTENPHAGIRKPDDLTTLDSANSQTTPQNRTMEFQEGTMFGAYRLIRRLGSGGNGEVWEAERVDTNRRLALKAMAATHRSTPELLERFKREGKLAASVNHSRCVFVFRACEPRNREK